MTKRATTTQAQVSRLIKAAQAAGLRVIGITSKPDGTVTVETVPLATSLDHESLERGEQVVL